MNWVFVADFGFVKNKKIEIKWDSFGKKHLLRSSYLICCLLAQIRSSKKTLR